MTVYNKPGGTATRGGVLREQNPCRKPTKISAASVRILYSQRGGKKCKTQVYATAVQVNSDQPGIYLKCSDKAG